MRSASRFLALSTIVSRGSPTRTRIFSAIGTSSGAVTPTSCGELISATAAGATAVGLATAGAAKAKWGRMRSAAVPDENHAIAPNQMVLNCCMSSFPLPPAELTMLAGLQGFRTRWLQLQPYPHRRMLQQYFVNVSLVAVAGGIGRSPSLALGIGSRSLSALHTAG